MTTISEESVALVMRIACRCEPVGAGDGYGTMVVHSPTRASIRAALEAYEESLWQPIETAPAVSVNRGSGMTMHPCMTTETLWVRDADGRTYEAWFVDATDEMGRTYWWDLDGEEISDPVEWMPHPLWAAEEMK